MWRAIAAAVAFVLAAVIGLLNTLVFAHPSLGLWVGLGVTTLVGAVLTFASAAGGRRSRMLPSDHDQVGVIREAARLLRIQEEKGSRDGITWPALPDEESERSAQALNTLGNPALARAWEAYLKAALDHVRLFRGDRVPPVGVEFSARENRIARINVLWCDFGVLSSAEPSSGVPGQGSSVSGRSLRKRRTPGGLDLGDTLPDP